MICIVYSVCLHLSKFLSHLCVPAKSCQVHDEITYGIYYIFRHDCIGIICQCNITISLAIRLLKILVIMICIVYIVFISHISSYIAPLCPSPVWPCPCHILSLSYHSDCPSPSPWWFTSESMMNYIRNIAMTRISLKIFVNTISPYQSGY